MKMQKIYQIKLQTTKFLKIIGWILNEGRFDSIPLIH